MEEINDNIEKSYIQQAMNAAAITGNVDELEKAFSNVIEKGKKAQIGEIREWQGRKFRKEATGWKPVDMGKIKEIGETISWEEEMFDEDTGEIVKIKRSSTILTENQVKNLEANFEKKAKQYQKLFKKYESVKEEKQDYEGKINDIKQDLETIKDYKNERRELMIDMEEDIPNAAKNGPEAEDKEAQRYGRMLNDIDEKIEKYRERYKSNESKLKEYEDKVEELDGVKYELQNKLWALDSVLEKMKREYQKNEELKSKKSGNK